MDFAKHITRIRAAATSSYGLGNISSYIADNLYLDGKRYSFENYEFQKKILDDTAPTSITVKVAQIGLSTCSYAHALACCAVHNYWGYGYVFPTTNDAKKACATRIDPMIAESPEVKRLVDKNLDSTELKRIGSSHLYFRGCGGETSALSISLDFLTIDEYDRCDELVAAQYVSRLQNKNTKMQRIFSTPTFDSVGVLKLAKTAKRYKQIATCSKCGHKWLPSYHEDIKIPGWNNKLNEINKRNLKDIEWRQAKWICPHCGLNPVFDATRLEWVCENPGDNYNANCWFISPVTAHKVLSPSYLVEASTKYGTYEEFSNQALGEGVSNTAENLAADHLAEVTIQGEFADSGVCYFGADMGLLCHATIMRVGSDGTYIILHRERIPLMKFEVRRRELMSKYRCTVSVHDVQPYVDMIQRLTEADPNAYGAVFTTNKNSEIYSVLQKEEDKDIGRINVRRVNINRTAAFDALMAEISTKNMIFQDQGTKFESQWRDQLTSLKRTQIYDKAGELLFQWVKGDGNDHFHFSLLYCYLAALLRGTATGSFSLSKVPLLTAFRIRQS